MFSRSSKSQRFGFGKSGSQAKDQRYTGLDSISNTLDSTFGGSQAGSHRLGPDRQFSPATANPDKGMCAATSNWAVGSVSAAQAFVCLRQPGLCVWWYKPSSDSV